MPLGESVLSVTGQTQWGGRQDGLFLQLPDVNSDSRDHIGPHPIRYADPQPVAAWRSVLSQGQLSGALIQTEVSEKSRGAIKQERTAWVEDNRIGSVKEKTSSSFLFLNSGWGEKCLTLDRETGKHIGPRCLLLLVQEVSQNILWEIQTEKNNIQTNKTANSLAPTELDGCHSNCRNLLYE